MSFGARLQEERKRLGYRQAEFANLVGIDMPKQSLYETNKRHLKAAYLSRLHPVGVDVLYVLTGKRSEGGLLDEETTAVLASYLRLPQELQEAMDQLVRDLAQAVHQGQGPTTAEDP